MGEGKAKSAGVWLTVKPFVNGRASGMLATCVIQPVDMIKVRIQLGQGSGLHVAKTMLREEGLGAFYKGLSAGLLRQATYTTARLGTFRILTNKAVAANDGKPLPLYQKALCALQLELLEHVLAALQIWRSFACRPMPLYQLHNVRITQMHFMLSIALVLMKVFWHYGKVLVLLWLELWL